MRILRSLSSLCILAATAIAVPLSLAQMSPVPSRVLSRVDDSSLTTLNNQVPAAAQAKYDLGEAPEATPLTSVRIVLSRSPEQDAALDRYLAELQDSSSANYHKWLTPEQFRRLYGPSDADIAAVTSWLQSHGFKLESLSAGRTNITFSGTAGQISSALHTSIHSFDAHGNRFYANTTNPQIPSALAPVIQGIAHLNTIVPHPTSVSSRIGKLDPQTGRLEPIAGQEPAKFRPNLTGGSGTASDPYFLFIVPGDAATIYDTPNSTFNANYTSGTSYTGHGVTIGVVGEAIFDTSIAQSYRKTFVGDSTAPTVTNVDGVGAGDNTGAIVEGFLDVEASGGLAPGAAISYYTSKDLFGAIDRSLDDNKVDILSVSYGSCEEAETSADNLQILNWWKQAAAQGIAVTVSAGDGGSAGCDNFDTQTAAQYGLQTSDLASTPYNIAVGGTDFSALGSTYSTYAGTTSGSAATFYRTAKKYIPESTWNDSVVQNGAMSANVPRTGNEANIVGGAGGRSKCSLNTSTETTVTCVSGYSKPSWQAGPGVPADGVRDLPDVSLMAGAGVGNAAWLICDSRTVRGTSFHADCTKQSDGNLYFDATGGTSASAPAFAAILALIQEKTGDRLGQAAQQIYALYNGSHSADIFHDITTGNNAVPCYSGTPDCVGNAGGYYFENGYDTATGYDLATGLGSVDAKNLVAYWGTGTNPDQLPSATIKVTPAAAAITNVQSLQVTVTVAAPDASHPAPTGTVDLVAGSYSSSAQTLAGGSYTFTIPAGSMAIGSQTIVVSYSGDSNYSSSLGSAMEQVTGVAPTIKVYLAVPSIPQNDSLPVRVNVGGQYSATGTVVLSGGGYTSAAHQTEYPDYAYHFVIPANTLDVGADKLTATYSGDANYTSGTASATVTVTAPVTTKQSIVGPVANQVAAGAGHTCELVQQSISKPESIQCWGSNNHGQLGNGTTTDSTVPVVIDSTTYTQLNSYDIKIVSLALGDNHTCALLPATGIPVCWGANASGQLGNSTTTDSSTPTVITSIGARVAAVVAGSAHTCVLVSDGTVQCWGDNTHGQLGNASTTNTSTGVMVSGITSAIGLAAGGNHTCALLTNKSVQCWGEGASGQLGNGATKDSSVPVAVSGINTAASLALGATHSCALIADGSSKCWGSNNHGQLGNSTTTDSPTPVAVSSLTGATSLSAGSAHTCAVLSASGGTAKCWGSNAKGQLGDNTTTDRSTPVATSGLTNITALSLGASHSCANNALGMLECWGDNATGQLGNGTRQAGGVLTPLPVSGSGGAPGFLSMGDTYACGITAGGTAKLGAGGTLTTNGAPFCWGNGQALGDGTANTSYVPVAVVGLASKVKQIFADTSNTCAIITDGTVQCWGNGSNGVLGNGTTTTSYTPVKVTGLTGSVTGMSVSQFFACALIADGTVQCWGYNGEGSLGDGTTTNSTTPVKVVGVTGATAISGTAMHVCVVISDGTVKCWGDNTSTPTAVTGITHAKSVTAGQDFNCAILSDTTVTCWGYNESGQLGNGMTSNSSYPSPPVAVVGVTGATQISAAAEFACALLSDQTVKCWGNNDRGGLGNGTTDNSSTPVSVSGLTNALAISMGGETSVALLPGGVFLGWGANLAGDLGDSQGTSSNNLSTDHYVYPVPVFEGQTISFNPPATLAPNTETDLLPLTSTSDELGPFFDGFTLYDCEIDYNSTNTAQTILAAKQPLLCGVRADQFGGYNLHGGSLAPAPTQERILQIGTAVAAPQATLSPSSLAFGNVTVNTTSTAQKLTLSNPGDATLNITTISVTGTDHNMFAQTSTCSATLAAGASCTISVTFTPTSANTFSALVSVTDDASGSPQTSSLTGTGTSAPAPQAALTPATADFGSVTINTSSTAQSFTLTNAGDAALPITSVGITGTNASYFVLGTNTCGTSLAAGGSCTFSVTFKPTATGSASATLSVVDSVGTQSSTLTGKGTAEAAPQAALTPATGAFGNVTIGSTSSPLTFTLKNAGDAALPISSIAITGANAASFSIATNTCTTSLAAGASCTMTITYTPAVAESDSAALSVTDSVGTQTASLTGTGKSAAAPQAALTPATADFGSVTVGSTSTAQTFTLKNAGDAALPITSIALGGTNAASFTITANTCSTSLAAGASCTMSVTFTPAATGSASATLSVVDSVGTQTSTFTGTGAAVAAPQAALTPASGAYGNVNAGATSPAQTFTLSNAGNASLPITSVTITGTDASSFNLATNTCGTTLAAAASCTLTVTFNPTAAGSFSASLSVVDSVGTQTASLTGTGLAVATADFTIAATPATQTTTRGSTVTYIIQLGSLAADNPFTNAVTLSATGLPGGTITFSPASATPGTAGAQSTMTVQTTTVLAAMQPATLTQPGAGKHGPSPWPFAAPVFASLLLLLPGKKPRSRKLFTNLACIVTLLGIAASTIGCGAGFALPSKTYTITVTGTSGSITHSTTVTLTVQ